MKTPIFLIFLGYTVLSTAGCHIGSSLTGSSTEQYTEDQTQTLDATDIQLLIAQTTNGNITTTGTTESTVRAQIQKTVRASSPSEAKSYAEQVEIFIVREDNTIRIYKDHPKFPKHVQVDITYNIQYPQKSDIDLTTLNGNFDIQNAEGSVRAKTTNGDISFDGNANDLTLRTRNGNILASVAHLRDVAQVITTNGGINLKILAGTAPVSATTTNGSVDVTLPSTFSGKLEASTVNGLAQSAFDIPRPEGSRLNRLFGTLGTGDDTTVILRSVNGNINLWKSQ